MADEKHPIRDGIIVTVIGGIILTLVFWILGGIQEVIKDIVNWILSVKTFIIQYSIFLWNHILSSATIPWGLLWLLIILSLIALWKIFSPFVTLFVKKPQTPKPYIPRLDNYRQDILFNVRWKWNNIFGTMPSQPLSFFCPVCSTRMVYSENGYPEKTSFICETCHRTVATLDGDLDFALSTVARQIERRINTGEWKDVVVHQHNQKAG